MAAGPRSGRWSTSSPLFGVVGVGQVSFLGQAPVGVIELDQPVDDHLRAGWSMVPSASAVHTAGRSTIPRDVSIRYPAERAEVTVIAATVANTGPGHPVAHLLDPVVDHRDHRRPPRIHRAVGSDVAQRRRQVFIVEVFQLLE